LALHLLQCIKPTLDIEHQAFTMNTMGRTNLLSNVEVVMLLTLCTNFLLFAHFFCNLCRWSCTFDICLANIEITHQYIVFDPLFLHMKHFETSTLLCVEKGILLDIGLNLKYSPVLQISNFPYSLKNLSSVWNYFRWRILYFN